MGFTEDFTGATLDPAWSENGTGGSFDATNDVYQIINVNGSGGTGLQRNTGGTLGSYAATVTLNMVEFSNPSTGADFKWKFFGPDGFMEVVLNSFGDMRLFHNDQDGGGGNIQPNTNIGLTGAGDIVTLALLYDEGTDMIDVSYVVNGGSSTSFYSGGGVDGPVDDLVTNFVIAEVFEFGAGNPVPTVQIQEWNLEAIPEPSAAALLAGCLGLIAVRRRRP
ncbi:MAG: PEP-CTERM sorting domain-containing protein [Verrucomicrobiales bacterium]